eukprot:TRINITY_DN105983_c0_g1_i1.p2 TRINITY_DN105983_c0_g1~~TRINITY_DN105983_c0_g1_i1.p2  ORF type:complete len:196 (-),score=65.61 TRINITY_DN105983_c0_g1_i1:332-919(-)
MAPKAEAKAAAAAVIAEEEKRRWDLAGAEMSRQQATNVARVAGAEIASLQLANQSLTHRAEHAERIATTAVGERNLFHAQLERERQTTDRIVERSARVQKDADLATQRAIASEEAAHRHHQQLEEERKKAQHDAEEAALTHRVLLEETRKAEEAAQVALALAGRPQRATRRERKGVQIMLNEKYEFNPNQPKAQE